jgi:hypothetical protein
VHEEGEAAGVGKGEAMRRLASGLLVTALAVGMLTVAPSAAGAPMPSADDWVPSQIQPTKIPLKWSRATLNDEVTLDEYGRRPVTDLGGTHGFDKLFMLLACERPEQLDCIESFGVVDDSDGTYRHEPFIRAHTFDVQRPDLPNEPAYAAHQTIWNVPGQSIEGMPVHLLIDGAFNPRDGHAFGFGAGIADIPYIPASYPNLYGCMGYYNDPCERSPLLAQDVTLRIVLRTSWLDPAVVMVRAKEPVLQVEDLGKGAHRITVTGRPMLLQSQASSELVTGIPKWVTSSFDLTIWDPRVGRVGSSECYRKGSLLFAYNGSGGSQPTWVPSEGRLKLNVVAPHYWPDGKTEWRGYYETTIPEATARCLWGIDPQMTSSLAVEVYNEEGEEKAATTAISFRDGAVNIRAYDFTYSEPTIAVKVTVKGGQRCYTQGAQVREFFCTKKGKKLVWAKRKR